jgi:serine/threonine protein phosphatase PrpC
MVMEKLKLMEENTLSKKWRCIGKSVQGASHKRSKPELPNQDSIHMEPESGPPVILAVSDGHGSAKSFRSDRGSRFAVETATKVIQEFFLKSSEEESDVSLSTLKNLKDPSERLLPRILVNEWRKAVNKDLGLSEDCPIGTEQTEQANFTDQEKDSLVQKDGEAAWRAVKNNHFLAYGATLLAVLVTEFFIVYIQIGDGDILQVDYRGETTHVLARDPKLIANETTSLCMTQAWNEFKVHVELYPKDSPKQKMPTLILVATDGYSNSYSTNDQFLQIGQAYRKMFKEFLFEDIEQQLEGFLQEISTQGSGDDITLGLIKRLETHDLDNQEAQKKQMTKIEDNMRQQEKISGIDSNKLKCLGKQQEKIDNKVTWVILGLTITFSLGIYLFIYQQVLEKRISEVEKNKSSPSPSITSTPTTGSISPSPSPSQK